MPPKKAQPFMVFAMEWKNKQGRSLSLAEAISKAGVIWSKMSEQEKSVYTQKAKNSPALATSKGKKQERLNCLGTPISYVEKEQEDAERREKLMNNTIATTVRTAAENGELEATTFIFISVNYFFSDGDQYVPAEISLAEFSLKSGVIRTFHTFVNPGHTMYGYLYDAQQHSKTTHNLPLPPDAMGEKDLASVYRLILDFIKQGRNEYPPIYTPAENMAMVSSALNFLAQSDIEPEVNINVYSIQRLLFVMKDETAQLGEVERPASHFITNSFFEKDSFEYEADIACDFHEDIDRTKYCTKSCVIRWGFMFADLMCNDIAIKPIPGRHCPKRVSLSYLAEPSSVAKKEAAPPEPKKERLSSDEEKWQPVRHSKKYSSRDSSSSNKYYSRDRHY